MGDVSGGNLKPPGGGNSNWGGNGTGGWQQPSGYVISHTQVSYAETERMKQASEYLANARETAGVNEPPKWLDLSKNSAMPDQPVTPYVSTPEFKPPITPWQVATDGLGIVETGIAVGVLAKQYLDRRKTG